MEKRNISAHIKIDVQSICSCIQMFTLDLMEKLKTSIYSTKDPPNKKIPNYSFEITIYIYIYIYLFIF